MKKWNLNQLERLTGVNRYKLGRVKKGCLGDVDIITEEHLFKIAISVFLTKVQEDTKPNSLSELYPELLTEGDDIAIAYQLIDDYSEYQQILHKIIGAYKNTDYLIEIIKFLNKGLEGNFPMSKEAKEFARKYKTLFIEQISLALEFRKKVSVKDIEKLDEIKEAIDKFFNTVDIISLSKFSKNLGISYDRPIDPDNKNLLDYLEKVGYLLDKFSNPFYDFIELIKKYEKLTTTIDHDLKRRIGMPKIYYASIQLKNEFKKELGIPFLGYRDHNDGYYLTHKILHLHYQLDNYNDAIDDLKRVLRTKKINIDAKDKHKHSLVRIAVDNEDIEVLDLLKKFDANPFSSYSFSIAVEKKNRKIINELITLVKDTYYSSLLQYTYDKELELSWPLIEMHWDYLQKEVIDNEHIPVLVGLAVLADNEEMLEILFRKEIDNDIVRIIINCCVSLDKWELAIPYLEYINPSDSANEGGVFNYCSYLAFSIQRKSYDLAEEIINRMDSDTDIDMLLHELAIFNHSTKIWDLFLDKAEEFSIVKKFDSLSTIELLLNEAEYSLLKRLLPKAHNEERSVIKDILVTRYKYFITQDKKECASDIKGLFEIIG